MTSHVRTQLTVARPVMYKRPAHIPKDRPAYHNKIKDMFGSAIVGYWPIWEPSGTVADDESGAAGLDGTHTGVTLGQPGIGDGRTSGLYDGSTDFTNVYSDALVAAFVNNELTISAWARMRAASVWTDTVTRAVIDIRADSNNLVIIRKAGANNTFAGFYTAGGTSKTTTFTTSTTDWFHVALTVSKSLDVARLFFNGVQQGADLTSLGTWVGALASTLCNIGAGSTVPANVTDGYIQHAFLLNRAATASEMSELARVN